MHAKPLSLKTLRSLSSSSSPSLCSLTVFVSHFSTSQFQSSFSYSSRRHDDESRNVKVSVWWDFENCNVSGGTNVYRIANAITAALRANGIKGPVQITAFGDIFQMSRVNQEALYSSGINFTHVPGGKNNADRSLLIDLMYWVSQNPPPAHLFLISGDKDFASTLHRLRMNNYNILLASPDSAPRVLCSAASIMWRWDSLLKGENLAGKHFNPPPDGAYGSWYGHFKVPLEDPFSLVEQPISPQSVLSPQVGSSEAGPDCKVRPVPKSLVKQIRHILNSFPKGIPITELRAELQRNNMNIDKNWYGYKKFSQFLLAMPHIVKLKPEGDGQFIVRGVVQQAPEPSQSRNGDEDIAVSLKLTGEEKSIFGSVADPPLPEAKEDISPEVKQTPLVNKILFKADEEKPSEEAQLPLPGGQKVVEAANKQVSQSQLASIPEQDSTPEVSFLRKLWQRWFGGNNSSSEVEKQNIPENLGNSRGSCNEKGPNTPAKCNASVDSSEKARTEGQLAKEPSKGPDPVPSSPGSDESMISNKTSAEAGENNSVKSTGFFNRIVKWCRFWSSQDSVASGDQSSGNLNQINVDSQYHDLFTRDSFWNEIETFIYSPRGSDLVSQSRNREEIAENLMKEGPLALKALSESSLLHLVDLLILDKKWVEESSSEKSPFTVTRVVEKSSGLGQPHAANGLRSIFLTTSQAKLRQELDGERRLQNISHSGVSATTVNRISSMQSRNEILVDCQKLVKEILRDYPQGYNIGSFRKLFLERYAYPLPVHQLGYKKLASLLAIMPGVKIESHYIIPSTVVPDDLTAAARNIEENNVTHSLWNLDSESSDISKNSDGISKELAEETDFDSQWEELGPVSSASSNREKFPVLSKVTEDTERLVFPDYEPSVSDDEFSDSEGEMGTTKQQREEKLGSSDEDSSLLQILDSWYKDGGESTMHKSEKVDGMVDCSRNGVEHIGLSGIGTKSETSSENHGRKQKVQKSYSFVAEPDENTKDELIDNILGRLKKSSKSRMHG